RNALEKERPDLDTSNFRLVIIGAGGAARAVVHSVREMGWRKVVVAARSLDAARRSFEGMSEVECIELDQLSRDEGLQFVVHATPVGQRSIDALLDTFQWQEGDIAADLVYNPLQTHFLERAATGGATTITG